MAQFKSLLITGPARVVGKFYASGGLSGNGSDITDINATNIKTGTLAKECLASSGVTAGSYGPTANATATHNGKIKIPQVTVDTYGRVTSVVDREITLPPPEGSVSGNAGTATKLQTARKIKLTGAVTGEASFDGSADASIAATLSGFDASKITSGTIDVARLPPTALERLHLVADDTARFALTTATVQNGDTVHVESTAKMYYVIDQTKLNSEAGYKEYAAGTAGSCSGNSATATKLANPRNINGVAFDGSKDITIKANLTAERNIILGGNMQGSAKFDGSKDITIYAYNRYASSNTGNVNNYPFHRFAYKTGLTGSYMDMSAVFRITKGYQGGGSGLFQVIVRTNSSTSGSTVSQLVIKWLQRDLAIPVDCIQAGFYNVHGATYVDLFYKSAGSYSGAVIEQVSIAGRGNMSQAFTLVTSVEANDTTSTDKKGATEIFKTIEEAGTELHDQDYSLIIKPTDVTILKAEQDSTGQKINTTYIKDVSISGKTVTITKGDGSTSTQTTQDTTYAAATTSQNGLMSAADKSKVVNTNIAYGTCETAAATAAKVVNITGNPNWVLGIGSRITVKFTQTNTAQNPTLNVNGTGAKAIMYGNNVAVTTSNLNKAGYANRYIEYMYDGTNWIFMGWSIDENSTYSPVYLGFGYGTCSTAEATLAKTVAITNYSLQTYGTVSIKFSNNVPANSTLNINSKGAKNIFYKGAKITDNVIKAGDTATFRYDGTQYQLISVDTVYEEMTSEELQDIFTEIGW